MATEGARLLCRRVGCVRSGGEERVSIESRVRATKMFVLSFGQVR